MGIRIIANQDLVQGAFDRGRILERKPIGFPQEGGPTKAFSNLFYWAHAWSNEGGLIGEHPHQGFEIISFVLTGEIEHYDSANRGWKKLQAGDVQVIQAGNGITHAEKILANSSIFQVWVDPDLRKTLSKQAAYRDYKESEFITEETNETSSRLLFGPGAMELDAELQSISEIHWKNQTAAWNLDATMIYSFFMLEGSMQINSQPATKGSFVIIEDTNSVQLDAISTDNKIFLVVTPRKPSYRTYADMYL